MVTQEDIDRSISYEDFFNLMEKLVKEEATTGANQSQSLIDYTKLNYSRMKRILKTTTPSNDVIDTTECLDDKLTWLVITESWCGDAAQNLPVLAKIAEINTNITLRIILRDENPDLMNQYITNGGKSIPKLICLDENLNELGTWGPRPKFLQDWLYKEKANPTMEMSELKKQFQVWYTKDKGQTLQQEMILLLKSWLNKECFTID